MLLVVVISHIFSLFSLVLKLLLFQLESSSIASGKTTNDARMRSAEVVKRFFSINVNFYLNPSLLFSFHISILTWRRPGKENGLYRVLIFGDGIFLDSKIE